MNEIKWSKAEKAIARRAVDIAYQRECQAIASKLKEMIAAVKEPAHIWHIHDFLTKQREMIDRKYDYRYGVLILVFARLVKEGWLTEAELGGLREDKIEKIKRLTTL